METWTYTMYMHSMWQVTAYLYVSIFILTEYIIYIIREVYLFYFGPMYNITVESQSMNVQ